MLLVDKAVIVISSVGAAVTMIDGTAVCADCAERVRILGSVYAAILEAREGAWVI